MKIHIYYETPKGVQIKVIAPDPETAIKLCEHIIKDNEVTDLVSEIFGKGVK